ncbi:glycoside hydrolase [bacterium]|nr:glycoside hydrolase [bacterium]
MSWKKISLLFILVLSFSNNVIAATPSSATAGPLTTSGAWQGQTYVAAVVADPAACPPANADSLNLICDHYQLTVAVDPAFWVGKSGGVALSITWADTANDFDLFVFDEQGNEVISSTQGGTNSEKVFIEKASGKYEILVSPFTVVNSGYSGTWTFSSQKASTSPTKWKSQTHGACCEGNLGAAGNTTYVLLPELTTGNDIKRSSDGGKTWEKVYPPLDVSVPFGIEGDLRAFGNDVVFFGTELTHGVAAHSEDRGANWTIVQIPVAFVANDQAWLYMGPVNVCPLQSESYVLTGWYRIGSVALFSCDGGLTWPIQTPLVGNNGDGPVHVVCETVAHPPLPATDSRIPNGNFRGMKAGRHGGWGTDGKFYWTEAVEGNLYVCKTNDFGVTWEGIVHPQAAGTPSGHVPTWFAFDDKGTLYVLHANKLYVSFDQGQSFKYVHTLPRYGNDSSVGDTASAFFVVKGGTIHVAVKEAAAEGSGNIWYLQGKHVDSSKPIWKEEFVANVGATRLDFMQIVLDGNGIPTIGYTTPPDFSKGVTTSSRTSAP